MLDSIKKIFQQYPTQTAVLSFMHFFSNLSEAIGVSLIIPVFQELLNEKGPQGKIYGLIENTYSTVGLPTTFTSILIGLCLVFIVRAALTIWAKYITVRISSQYLYETQTRLFKKITNARLTFLLDQKQGVLTNALTQEVTRAANTFVSLNQWISSVLTALVYIIVAITVSGWLAIVASIIGIIALSPLRLITRRTLHMGQTYTAINEEAQSQFIESLTGIKYIKGSALEEKVNSLVQQTGVRYKETWFNVAFIANIISLYTQPIAVIVLSGILIAGKSLHLSVAELIVFLLAFQRLLPTLSFIQAVKNDFNANYPALERIEFIENLAKQQQERQTGNPIDQFKTEIRLQNITFRHLKDENLFENLDLTIPAGHMVALLGHSGSGKSTLVDLLLGFHTPQVGIVSVDGVNLENISLHSWRKHIGYVAQEPFLFHDTIRNNIAWDMTDISDDEIAAAAKQAHAHEFIINLKNGYNTVVGDRGGKLSGGQKQRLALARALLRKPKILILDEATSALDYESESLIKDTIIDLKRLGQMTIVLVAHRLTTVKDSDCIYVLEKGKIIEQGHWDSMVTNPTSFIAKSLAHH